MTRQAITAADGPTPVGPYSHAIASDGLVYTSGMVGIDPSTGKLVDGGIADQTDMTLRNLAAVLRAAGCTFADVLKCNVYLADIGDWAGMNPVYASHMPDPPPARTTLAVRDIPLGALVEIEAVARRP